ncbi:MAG: hypothetical protein O9282_04505 [Flavobacterium sp.]|jgi:hypothetical protein|uniref:hypothetical protein n=1 Tax=Flavobacterium sp. TaxID=239 RepID=UPI0022C9B2DF|nr:hypothetical protein [Flavobacterium sp.]MCZ8089987.1 hypothetical protein [Flavobacterium sp.]MCZ8330556.1 hypothetical protein [Flavobacterium sp.]
MTNSKLNEGIYPLFYDYFFKNFHKIEMNKKLLKFIDFNLIICDENEPKELLINDISVFEYTFNCTIFLEAWLEDNDMKTNKNYKITLANIIVKREFNKADFYFEDENLHFEIE